MVMEKFNGGALVPALENEVGRDEGISEELKDKSGISDEELANYVGDLILQLRKLALKSGDTVLAEKLMAAYEAIAGKNPQSEE